MSIAALKRSETPPAFNPNPQAYRIKSEAEAIEIAKKLAFDFAKDASLRDRERILPTKELDAFSASGLWAITVPKAYGGLGASFKTLTDVIKVISAVDPSIGQIPQNHFVTLDVIRILATDDQKAFWFGKILEGYRLGSTFAETKSKNVGAFETRVTLKGGRLIVNGEKLYATGALFAHFIHVGAVYDNGKVHLAIVPFDARGVKIIDNGSSFGQRTTASGSVLLENVEVDPIGLITAYLGGERPSSDGAVSQIIQAAVDAGIAASAIQDTIAFIKSHASPWPDSGQEHAHEDVFTISQIGDLIIKLHAAEALLELAAADVDEIISNPTEEGLSLTSVSVAKAKILTTEIAILASDKLHELGGTKSSLAAHNLDRHWRNARTHTLHDPVRWKYFHIGNYALNGVKPPRHSWN